MRSWFLLALFIPVETAASGSLVVLGSTVELPAPALAAPTAERCRQRPRILTPMLVAYAGLQAADAHSTLRAWAVRSAPRSATRGAAPAPRSVAAVGRDASSPVGLIILRVT